MLNRQASADTPAPGAAVFRSTAVRREWLGWFGIMFWFYSMINGYQYLPNGYNSAYYLSQDMDYIWWFVLAFLTMSVISITAIGFRYGRDPNKIGKLAFYTAPVAVVFTAAFPFMPQPWGSVLYTLTPALLAPVLVRRAYGVVYMAKPGYVFMTYMSGIAIAFATMNPFLDYCCDYDAPAAVAYAVYAASALLAWMGVRSPVGLASPTPEATRFSPSRQMLLLIGAACLLMFWFIKMKSNINYTVEQFDDLLYIPVYYVLAPVSYVLFGWISDKGYERIGVSVAFTLFLLSVQLSFIAQDPMSMAMVPLVFANHFLGICVEFLILAIPVYFFTVVKRPVFAASFGVVSYLLCWIFSRSVHPFLPDALMRQGAFLFVSAATTVIVLLFLLNIIFQLHRKSTLAASFYAMLHSWEGGSEVSHLADAPDMRETEDASLVSGTQGMTDAGFTQEEIKIALLLLEGKTRSEILRSLHISAAEAKQRERAIRDKLLLLGIPHTVKTNNEAVLVAIAYQYKLTRRETDVLRCLWRGMSNGEIASDLMIEENTVRKHYGNLMKKISLNNRADVATWVEAYQVAPE